jgi:hypothetical protein
MSKQSIDTANMSVTDLSDLISNLQKHLELKKRDIPKVLDNIDTTQIVSMAEEVIQSYLADGCYHGDYHYFFEVVMEAVYGKDVWKFINSF